jgi:hypothetical protein
MLSCTGDSTHPVAVEPEPENSSSAEPTAPTPSTLAAGGEVNLSFSMTPEELLADPFLVSMIGSLGDQRTADEISAAIEGMRAGLLAEDQNATKSAYRGALAILRSYAKTPGVQDDDAVQLDAIALTLDEVERLRESDEKKPAKR